jgi:hypothetical protein
MFKDAAKSEIAVEQDENGALQERIDSRIT